MSRSQSSTPPPPPSHPSNTTYQYRVVAPWQVRKDLSFISWNPAGASQTNINTSKFDYNVPADVRYVETRVVENSSVITRFLLGLLNLQLLEFLLLLLHILSTIFFLGYFPARDIVGICPDKDWENRVFLSDLVLTCVILTLSLLIAYLKTYCDNDEYEKYIKSAMHEGDVCTRIYAKWFMRLLHSIGWIGLIVHHITVATVNRDKHKLGRCSIEHSLYVISALRSVKCQAMYTPLLLWLRRCKLKHLHNLCIELLLWVLYVSFVSACLITAFERIASESYFSTAGIFESIIFTLLLVLSLGTSFGDMFAMTTGSRVVVIFIVIVSVVLLFNFILPVIRVAIIGSTSTSRVPLIASMRSSGRSNKLFRSLQNWYLVDAVPNEWRSKFIIVAIFAGNILDIEHVKMLLEEAFNFNCENAEDCRIVLMSTQTIPSSSFCTWDNLITRKRWQRKIVFMCGSGMLTTDLERACVDSAEQVYVVNGATNSYSGVREEYSEQDDRVVLQTEYVRTFNSNAEIYAEVFCPESRIRALEAGADHCMSVLGISYQVIGRMISCPGIDHLLVWTNFFPAVFPQEYYGLNFPVAAKKAYVDFGVIPFAVIECFPHILSDEYNSKYNVDHIIDETGAKRKRNDIHRRMLLNPSRLSITCSRLIYCLAPDAYAMYNFITHRSRSVRTCELPRKNGSASTTFQTTYIFDGQETVDKRDRQRQKRDLDANDRKYIFNPKQHYDEFSSKSIDHEDIEPEKGKSEQLQFTALDMLLPKDLLQFVPGSEHLSANSSRKKKIRLDRRRERKRMTGLEIMASMDPSRAWLAGSNIVDHGQPLWSMWGDEGVSNFEWRSLESAEESGFAQHTVICCEGCSSQHIHYIIRALRSNDSSTWTPIVIISDSPPLTSPRRITRDDPAPAHLWPHVYWLKGHPRLKEDLVRAAVGSCRDVVILPSDKFKTDISNEADIEKLHLSRLDEIGSIYFTLQEVRKLARKDVKFSIATKVSFTDVNIQSCDVRSIRRLFFKQIHNPYLIPLIGSLLRHSPQNLGERDEMQIADNEMNESSTDINEKVQYRFNASQTSKRVEILQDFESLVRESFLRLQGIPPFLHNKPFKQLMEVFSDKYNTLPLAIVKTNGQTITCPNAYYVIEQSDLVMCTTPMEYDQFLRQSAHAVNHARSKDSMKERRQLLRSTHRLIVQQLQAVESILERVNYVLRKRDEASPESKDVDASINRNGENDDETLNEKAENLLNAVVGVRKTLREKQHILKGIALEHSDSVEAAEVVFQQITINQSLMNILEDRCMEIQKQNDPNMVQ